MLKFKDKQGKIKFLLLDEDTSPRQVDPDKIVIDQVTSENENEGKPPKTENLGNAQ